MRKQKLILFLFLLIIAGGVSYAGYRTYNYIEHNPGFCASCHLMNKAWNAWASGPHQTVSCKACHKQDILKRSLMLWNWAINKTEEVQSHTSLDKKVCEKCHLSQKENWKQVGETAGHRLHVKKANLQCLACHFPSLHVFKPKVEDCERCHSNSRVNIGGMQDFHCTTCHDFLAKGKQAKSIMPTRDTCLACHQEMQMKNETFPVDGPMVFNCSDCHKLHTKPFIKSSDCLSCHTEILVSKDHFERKTLTICTKCHKPHDWTAKRWD